MNLSEQQKSPKRTIVGFVVVVLLHIGLVWALVSGLGQSIVDKIRAPTETKIIQEVKPPPKEAPPPPPPPQLAAPPPPFIPPPDINVQTPPPAAANAIAAVTHAAPIGPVAPPGPRPPPAGAVPDSGVSARPIGGSSPVYPQAMQEEERSGKVTVTCDIEPDGRPSNCELGSVQGGAAFGTAVMKWLNSGSARYKPAVKNGVAIREPHHTLVINFGLSE